MGMDGSMKIPVAVLARTVSGTKKAVRIFSGVSEIEITPASGSMQVKLNGRSLNINKGQTYYEKSSTTQNIIVEIKRYQDDVFYVYVANQFLHVVTDGERIEVVAPQLLKGRAVGLCGDLNGERIADLKTPQECIMKSNLAAMSYMLNPSGNNHGSVSPRCAGIPAKYRPEYNHEKQECFKEISIPTQVLPIFERLQSLNKQGMGGRRRGSGSW